MWVISGLSERRQHAGEDLQAQIFFVAQAVGATLEDPDLVVQTLDEAERDFVLGFTVGSDAVPVALDHGGELFVGREALPLEAGAPVVEEAPCPGFSFVCPELVERLFQQICRVQALVCGEQRLQSLPAFEREVFAA